MHDATTPTHTLVRLWREMSYAQRRMFEIRTGITTDVRTGIESDSTARCPATVAELQRIWNRG